jgi:hypothetical protein
MMAGLPAYRSLEASGCGRQGNLLDTSGTGAYRSVAHLDKSQPGESRGRKATGPRFPPRRRRQSLLTPRRTPRSPSCRKVARRLSVCRHPTVVVGHLKSA